MFLSKDRHATFSSLLWYGLPLCFSSIIHQFLFPSPLKFSGKEQKKENYFTIYVLSWKILFSMKMISKRIYNYKVVFLCLVPYKRIGKWRRDDGLLEDEEGK